MRQPYALDTAFVIGVLALSLVGFSSLFTGEHAGPDAYQALHIVTSLAWLVLLLWQLRVLRQRDARRHRVIGKSIFVAGPVLVGSVSLLTVHSAAKDAIEGRADTLVVQNVAFTLEVALLILLAFLLRHQRKVHGALLLSTALMFMTIALFFTLVSYVPGFRAAGPGTPPRFAAAGQVSALVGAFVGLLFFLRSWRTGWPWLLTSVFFLGDGYVQFLVAEAGQTTALTARIASVGRVPGAVLGLTLFGVLLALAWRVDPSGRPPRERMASATGH